MNAQTTGDTPMELFFTSVIILVALIGATKLADMAVEGGLPSKFFTVMGLLILVDMGAVLLSAATWVWS